MKKLFVLVILTLSSCVTSNQEKDIRIYYQDGSIEDVTLSTKEGYTNQFGDKEALVYFNNGCLYTDHHESKYEAHFTGCIRCGVKDYDVLEIRTLKEE